MISIKEKMEVKLDKVFSPTYLKVVNESKSHHGHVGDDGSGESHFSVTIVSKKFIGESRVECQRMLFNALDEEMKTIHALSISAKA